MPSVFHVMLVGPSLGGKTTMFHEIMKRAASAGPGKVRVIPILEDGSVGQELLSRIGEDSDRYHLPYQCKLMAHQLRALRRARREAERDTEHEIVVILEERSMMDPSVVCSADEVQEDAARILGPFEEFMAELMGGEHYLPPPDAVLCVDAPDDLVMQRLEAMLRNAPAEEREKARSFLSRSIKTWNSAYTSNPWGAKHVLRIWNGCSIRDDTTLRKIKMQRFRDAVSLCAS